MKHQCFGFYRIKLNHEIQLQNIDFPNLQINTIMDITAIINRVKFIILQPGDAWIQIKAEQTDIKSLFKDYIFYLALIPAIASFIGYGFIGFDMGFFGRSASIEWGATQAIQTFVSTIISILTVSWIITKLAPNYQCEVSMDESAKLVGYAYTPALVCGVFYLIPSLSVLGIIGGIYSLYLFYQGFGLITEVREEKKSTFFIVSLLVSIVAFIVIGIVIGSILGIIGLNTISDYNL